MGLGFETEACVIDVTLALLIVLSEGMVKLERAASLGNSACEIRREIGFLVFNP